MYTSGMYKMRINKEHALKAFKDYTANYDLENVSVSLKIAHTYRVAVISEMIAESVSENAVFAWLFGLLHDIGRFEQVTRYGTFKNALSVDHAELGADILFHNNLFDTFISEADLASEEFQKMKPIAEIVIRLHNKLRLPENLDACSRRYAKILRDADKIDIFHVLTESPYDKRNLTGLSARTEVMRYVTEHRCVPRPAGNFQYNDLEALIAQCCMAFELEYPKSREIVIEQGYLKKLLEQDIAQLAIVRTEIMKAWKIKI